MATAKKTAKPKNGQLPKPDRSHGSADNPNYAFGLRLSYMELMYLRELLAVDLVANVTTYTAIEISKGQSKTIENAKNLAVNKYQTAKSILSKLGVD